jgi:hypothetical protein
MRPGCVPLHLAYGTKMGGETKPTVVSLKGIPQCAGACYARVCHNRVDLGALLHDGLRVDLVVTCGLAMNRVGYARVSTTDRDLTSRGKPYAHAATGKMLT